MSRKKFVDRFPQYISGSFTTGGTNVYNTEVINLPVPRTGIPSTRAVIIEFLWVEVFTGEVFNAANEIIEFEMYWGPARTSIGGIGTNTNIAMIRQTFDMVTSGAAIYQEPLRYEMQSKEGYGFLFAGDKISIGINTNNAAGTVGMGIGYFTVL